MRVSFQQLLFALADGKASEINTLSKMEVFAFYRFAESRKVSAKKKRH
jgi:hypothetical protein